VNFSYLLKIEKEKKLLNECIDDFCFWVYIRHSLSTDIQNKIYNQSFDTNRLKSQKFSAAIKQISISFSKVIIPAKHVDLLFVNNGGRRYLEEGIFVDSIADDIMKEYESSLMLEYSGGNPKTPAFTANLKYIDIYTVEGYAYRYLAQVFNRKKVKSVYEYIYNTIKIPIEDIYRNYEVDCCCVESIAAKLTDYYFVRKVLKKKYLHILQKTTPKAIVEVWHGTLEKMVFTKLAKEKNIPVIELQHGATGIGHLAYNYYEIDNIKQFPDYFFVFSEYWKECIYPPVTMDKVVVTGCPYIERKVQKYKAKRKSSSSGVSSTLLFLADKYNTKLLMDIAREVKLILKNDIRIIVKLHPLDNKSEIISERESIGVEVYSNTECDLYDALVEAGYVVCTGGTTSLYEALAFGLRGFIYLDKAYEEFVALCQDGYTEGFSTVEELIAKLKIDNENDSKDVFWATDSLSTSKKAIDIIISDEP